MQKQKESNCKNAFCFKNSYCTTVGWTVISRRLWKSSILTLSLTYNNHSLMSNLFGTQIERLFWSTNWANCATYCWKLSSWWYWGRFHQHFTCALFVQKFIQSQTLSREKLLKGLSCEKYLHKMLMKLTPEWHFSYQMPCACVIFLIWLKQPLKLCIGDNSCSSSSSQVGRGGWSRVEFTSCTQIRHSLNSILLRICNNQNYNWKFG